MRRRAGAAGFALFALVLAACKDRGERTIILDNDAGCQAADLVQVYALRGRSCGDCACGGCITSCDTSDDTCVVACPGGLCTTGGLADGGLLLFPSQPGEYAVVFQYLQAPDGGVPRVVAGACAVVSIQSDGTESSDITAPLECCQP